MICHKAQVINNLNAEIFQQKGFLADCVIPGCTVIDGDSQWLRTCPLIGQLRGGKYSTSSDGEKVKTLVKS